MNIGYVRNSTHADIGQISNTMRIADVAEIKAFSGSTPEEALRSGMYHQNNGGRCITICLPNGLPVGMYGVVPSGEPKVGIVWMLASDNIQPLYRQFLRESAKGIQDLCKEYSLIFNYTDARNEVHHRWIKWAGFTVIKRHEEFGVEKRPFLEFVRIMETSNV